MSEAPRVTLEYIPQTEKQAPCLNVNFHGQDKPVDPAALASIIIVNCGTLFKTEPIIAIQILATRMFDNDKFMDKFMDDCIGNGYEATAYKKSKRLEVRLACH